VGAALGGEEFGFGFEGQFSPAGTADDEPRRHEVAAMGAWGWLRGCHGGVIFDRIDRRGSYQRFGGLTQSYSMSDQDSFEHSAIGDG